MKEERDTIKCEAMTKERNTHATDSALYNSDVGLNVELILFND